MKYLFIAAITCVCYNAIEGKQEGKYLHRDKPVAQETNFTIGKKSEASKTLIVNAFDAMDLNARKNKKDLFRDLADSVTKWLEEDLHAKSVDVVVIDSAKIDTANLESIVLSLLKENDAKLAVVITSLNAWFELTDVAVEKNEDKSKSKTAFFDICSVINYKLYSEQGLVKKSDPQIRRFFTSRGTAGSLLSFGPDIVGKRKHAIKIMHDNTIKMLLEL